MRNAEQFCHRLAQANQNSIMWGRTYCWTISKMRNAIEHLDKKQRNEATIQPGRCKPSAIVFLQKLPKDAKVQKLKAQKCCILSLYVEVYVLFDWLKVIPSGWWWYSVSLDPSVTPETSALPFLPFLKPVCQCGKRQRNHAISDRVSCVLYVGLSENSVPLNPMVLLIIIPIKWL